MPNALRVLEARYLRRDAARRVIEKPAELIAAGTLAGVADVPDAVRRLFVTAAELDIDRHVAVQHAFQRHVDNAVSKTINLPEDAAPAAVERAYLEGWRLGLKGVTVYRSGSRQSQVFTLGTGEDPAAHERFARCDASACRV